MKRNPSTKGKRERGLTMVEILVVMVVIAVIAYLLIPSYTGDKEPATRTQCVCNLMEIGRAYRIWEGDHNGNFPMAVSETNGGSMEFVTGLNAFRHFQVMSNELSTPKILLCPAESDRSRRWATNFTAFGNSNISIFVGMDANESNVQMILSGDRNITNGTPIRNGLLRLTTNALAGWTSEMHKTSQTHRNIGNILLADGSVQRDNMTGLKYQILNTGDATNRMQMPVVGP